MTDSAGILLYRRRRGRLEVLLVHPGGPFWARKDEGAWSIPKGEANGGEDLLSAAIRELREETGYEGPAGGIVPLGSITQKAGKVVTAWGVEGDLDPAAITSNTFEMEWPPRSGRKGVFPEVDRAEWFDSGTARIKLNPAQAAFVDRLEAGIGEGRRDGGTSDEAAGRQLDG
jgi:predicted NUDIX family NTP pyrophosphohydrolase